MLLQQSPVFLKDFSRYRFYSPPIRWARTDNILHYFVSYKSVVIIILHMAIITCNAVFSENPLRAVGYFVYIHIYDGENF